MRVLTRTLGVYTVVMLLLVGLPEYYLHRAASSPSNAFANRHYGSDKLGAIFEPVPQCKLPPGQPYGMTYLCDSVKVVLFFFLFGGVPDRISPKDQVPWLKRLGFAVVTVYQFVMIPITMISTIYHFVMYMGPFETVWHAYQCFGVLWTTGPWWFNALLFLAKAFMQEGSLGCRLDVESDDASAMEAIEEIEENMEKNMSLQESLLGAKNLTAFELHFTKMNIYYLGNRLTYRPYLLLWAPFVVTHVIPGAVMFAPQVLMIVCVNLLVFRAVAVDEHGNNLFWELLLCPLGRGTCRAISAAEKSGGLMIIPLLIGMNVIAEFLVLEATYFYAGEGYMGSMATAWLERRTELYCLNFKTRILGAFWASADLLNEII